MGPSRSLEHRQSHVHLLVRGVAEDGSDLIISRDYISHGLRSVADDLVSAEPEHEIRSALEREVEADRRLDPGRSEERESCASTAGRLSSSRTSSRAT